jgi:hypothetical protein
MHNIIPKIEKNRFPIGMFMDVPKNTVFYTYKKRKLFNEVVETVDNLKRRLDHEEELRLRALEPHHVSPQEEYHRILQERNAMRGSRRH